MMHRESQTHLRGSSCVDLRVWMTLVRARPKAHIERRPSGPMAAAVGARKAALGLALDWILDGAGPRAPVASVEFIEDMTAVHCAEKVEYHARLAQAAISFSSIIDGERDVDEEIRWRTRGADPADFADVSWIDLWTLRDSLAAAVTPRLVAVVARWVALTR